ncbi:GGDEF domain-containing protein [Pseudokineococcus lusitanus]|uniref:Diguanylate cyclase (GGDEF)-like protein n=1 Tax=Pseudokineococcus lusitanus TaxID=763993 RepID=A0A3N1HR96_9ACTN|nr:GGDEF domain-containing protein [Pseudokineococcus lusitanus]ROP45033.1 diguanylate cyclase (GGDEF)-like protein [Pseudokineococcus lusitanus]
MTTTTAVPHGSGRAGAVPRPARGHRAARPAAVAWTVVVLPLVALVAGVPVVAARPPTGTVAGGALLVAALVAVAVVARRAVRGPERRTWRLVAAAAAALALTVVPAAGIGTFHPAGQLLAVGGLMGGSLLLVGAQMRLLATRMRSAGPYGWFDVVGGGLSGLAVVWALLVAPVREAVPGWTTTDATVALVPTAVALLSWSFMVVSTSVSGGWADVRVRVVVVSSTVLSGGTGAVALLTAAGVGLLHLRSVLAACAAVVVGLLALAAVLPRPRGVVKRDEDQRVAVIGPLVLTVVGTGVLLAAQVAPVPLAASVAATASVLVVVGKVVVVLRTLTAYQRARRDAETDELTGLGNRRALLEHLARSVDEPTAVLLLDLDGFKAVNDTHGHAAGDALLRQVADRLRAVGGGHAVRLGGDEFAVVVPEGSLPEAEELARRLHAALAVPHELGPGRVVVGASVGVSAAPGQGAGGEALLRRADAAMYRAKQRGGGVVAHGDGSTAPRPGAVLPPPLPGRAVLLAVPEPR